MKCNKGKENKYVFDSGNESFLNDKLNAKLRKEFKCIVFAKVFLLLNQF